MRSATGGTLVLLGLLTLCGAQSNRVELEPNTDPLEKITELKTRATTTPEEMSLINWIEFISLLHQNSRIREAETAARQAITATKHPVFYLGLGEALLSLADCDGALAALETAVNDWPGRPDEQSWTTLVMAYWRCGRQDDAFEASQRMMAPYLNPAHSDSPANSADRIKHLWEQSASCPASSFCPATKQDRLKARRVVGFAHSNFAHYYWVTNQPVLARLSSDIAQKLNRRWEQWPYYCSKWERFFGPGQ